MIETERLSFRYPDGRTVLDDITLTIEPGAHVALMGANGSGKTTLALILKGLLRPTAGRVAVDGVTGADETSRFGIMRRVGMVFQNPDDAIVATTVERELAFGLENLNIPQAEMERRIGHTLERFGLSEHRHGNPCHLSGGEKQRLALAAVMIMEPSHLVLDEPTSLLDPWSRGPILDHIHDTAGRGAAVIHITQFADEARTADRVLILEGGRIAFDGPPGDMPGVRPSASNGPAITGLASTAPRAGSVVSLDAVSHVYHRGAPFETSALDGVSLELPPASATALLGPAGSGKTTLLEIAAGVTAPSSGTVSTEKGRVRALAFQFPEDQVFGDTVHEFLVFGPRNRGMDAGTAEKAAISALETMGLDPRTFPGRDPFTLSGGEKRRVALAGVLAMKPDALFLDEPTAGLDADGTAMVAGVLRDYASAGGTLMFSTHDFAFVRSVADTAVVLEKGRVESAGDVARVFAESALLGGVTG